MDLQMPVLDGYETTRRLRLLNGNWAPDLPVIAMTAHSKDEDADACRAAGMDDHVGKPIDVDELFAALKRWRPVEPIEDSFLAGLVSELYGKLQHGAPDAGDSCKKMEALLLGLVHDGRMRRLAELIRTGRMEEAAAFLGRLNAALRFLPAGKPESA
jgi:CheY-like chemotaxis protein